MVADARHNAIRWACLDKLDKGSRTAAPQDARLHQVDELPTWMDSEQEYRGACACGQVFAGLDEHQVQSLMRLHLIDTATV